MLLKANLLSHASFVEVCVASNHNLIFVHLSP